MTVGTGASTAGLGRLLRIRRLRQQSAIEMPDGSRRLRPEVPGNRRGGTYFRSASQQGFIATGRRQWETEISESGWQSGFRQSGCAEVFDYGVDL